MEYGPSGSSGVTTGYSENAKQAVESPISRELNSLTKNIAELEQIVAALGSRLTPVTIPQPPRPSSGADRDTGKGIPPASGVVCDAIAVSNQRISELRTRVIEIRDCLAI